LQGLDAGKKVFINFPTRLIRDDAAFALPQSRCVIELLENVEPEPEIVKACEKLKEAGYVLALDDFVGQAGFEPFIDLADIIKVEVLGLSVRKITALANRLRGENRSLLAEKVEDRETYELTRDLGFDYFQGYFFSKPEIVPGRKIPTGTMVKIQLLRELADPECDFDALSRIIENDVSLSYRLLRFINSVAFGLRSSVQSIQQAVALLGLVPLKQWAQVVLMSDMDSTPRGGEILHTSLQRARFLEHVAMEMKSPPYPSSTMFLLGLFSKLDALLGHSMEDILEDVPLEEGIKQALFGGESKGLDWLNLMEHIEDGRWEMVKEILAEQNLSSEKCAVRYSQASTWAHNTLSLIR